MRSYIDSIFLVLNYSHSTLPHHHSVLSANMDGSLAHMFWLCTKLHTFWSEIFHCYSDVYQYSLPPNPEMAILVTPELCQSNMEWSLQRK